MKSELFAKILSIVADVTELSTNKNHICVQDGRVRSRACAVCAFLLQVWRSNLRH